MWMKITGKFTTCGKFSSFFTQCRRFSVEFLGLHLNVFPYRLWKAKISQSCPHFTLNSPKIFSHSLNFHNFSLIFSRESEFFINNNHVLPVMLFFLFNNNFQRKQNINLICLREEKEKLGTILFTLVSRMRENKLI